MPKPACLKCQRFYRPEKNGFVCTESMPVGGDEYDLPTPPGTLAPERWTPYKVWRTDLWKCHGCGHLLVAGWAAHPVAEHYQQGFAEAQAMSEGTINDC